MNHLWIFLNSYLPWTLGSVSPTDCLWAATALLGVGWFHSTMRRT